jgi:hypothetical protein
VNYRHGSGQIAKIEIYMKKVSVEFSLEEMQALLEMVENQLFRMKYIDPKIPGHTVQPEAVRAANGGVQALREAFKTAKGFKTRVGA